MSMFTFGQNLGLWQGILSSLSIPYRMPTPRQWRKGLVDGKAGTMKDSEADAHASRLVRLGKVQEAIGARKHDMNGRDARVAFRIDFFILAKGKGRPATPSDSLFTSIVAAPAPGQRAYCVRMGKPEGWAQTNPVRSTKIRLTPGCVDFVNLLTEEAFLDSMMQKRSAG